MTCAEDVAVATILREAGHVKRRLDWKKAPWEGPPMISGRTGDGHLAVTFTPWSYDYDTGVKTAHASAIVHLQCHDDHTRYCGTYLVLEGLTPTERRRALLRILARVGFDVGLVT